MAFGRVMVDKNVEYSNPDKLPIENVVLTVDNAGVVQRIKALDTYWVSQRPMRPYEAPPSEQYIIIGAEDKWLADMEVYLENLEWLLSLKYHVFWSTVLYHAKCMDALVSFLQEANPPYISPHSDEKIAKLYDQIRRYVLIIFTRLTTDRETEYEWMTEEYMSGILYDNFIFTIPIIWDLCLAYGFDNKELVSQLVKRVFSIQPRYMEDTEAAVCFVNEAFKYIILQVNQDYDSEESPNLPETFQGFSEIRRPSNIKHPDDMTFDMLKDLVVHLLDSAMTIRIFIEVYPDSVKILKNTNFVNSMVQIYEYGLPQLYEKLEETIDNTSAQYKVVEEYLDIARSELIDIFREILAVYKNAIFCGEGNVSSSVEEYLAVMLDGLSERLLIQDYHACYPVHEDIDMLRQVYPQIDPVKTDYILNAIYSNLEEPIPDHLLSTNQEMTNGYSELTDDEETTDSDSEATDDKIPDNIKQESMISEVKDVLPQLGDGFILKCLEHYGFNSEVTISRILEKNLDPCLKDLDESMPLIPEDPLDQKFLETGIARLNVFDGDEFDVMHRDNIDTSKIHVGKKKPEYSSIKDMLDDKTEVKKVSNIYTKYSLVCDYDPMYDDDYDDSYDEVYGGPVLLGDTTPDDLADRRPYKGRGFRSKGYKKDQLELEEASEPEEQQPGPSRNNLDFCVNPEILRARREASYQARMGKFRPPPTIAAKTKDVVGKPKGQGQEKEVLVNRDKKEKNKSARANHNRRQGAQYKRNQGLMPS